MMITRRAGALAAAIAAAALLLTSCAGGSASGGDTADVPGVTADSITIGTTIPQTGPVAGACGPLLKGAQAWFDQVNEDGGIGGRSIDYTTLDDAYDATQALTNARELAAEPVFTFFQSCGSIAPPALIQVADQQQIPYLFPASGQTATVTGENFFTMWPSYAQEMLTLVPYAAETYGEGSLLLVNAKLPASDETAAAVEKAANDAGLDFLGTENITNGEPDLGPLALKIKEAQPDYIVFVGIATDGGRLINTLKDQGALPSKKFLVTAPFASREFLTAAGGNADDNTLVAGASASWGSPEAEECTGVLEAADVEPDLYSLFSCAMAQLFVQAVKDTGDDLTRENLVATLQGYEDVSVSPLIPPVTFSADRHTGSTELFVLAPSGDQFETEATIPLITE